MAKSIAASSEGFWLGSLVFLCLLLLATSCGAALAGPKYRSMVSVLVPTAFICMWLMWAITWLMQWHPLIVPEPEAT